MTGPGFQLNFKKKEIPPDFPNYVGKYSLTNSTKIKHTAVTTFGINLLIMITMMRRDASSPNVTPVP